MARIKGGAPGLSEASQWACLPAGAAAAGVNLGRPSRGRVRVLASSRFAKASTANKQLRVGTDYGDDDSATSSERDTSPVRHCALHPLQRDDRKLSAHGRGVSSMRTTASKRQSSLELAQAVRTLLDGIHLDEFDLDEVRRLAGQALQGGEYNAVFKNLKFRPRPSPLPQPRVTTPRWCEGSRHCWDNSITSTSTAYSLAAAAACFLPLLTKSSCSARAPAP